LFFLARQTTSSPKIAGSISQTGVVPFVPLVLFVADAPVMAAVAFPSVVVVVTFSSVGASVTLPVALVVTLPVVLVVVRCLLQLEW
jgi:hypothetical protein